MTVLSASEVVAGVLLCLLGLPIGAALALVLRFVARRPQRPRLPEHLLRRGELYDVEPFPNETDDAFRRRRLRDTRRAPGTREDHRR
jgi:hypothetical protein